MSGSPDIRKGQGGGSYSSRWYPPPLGMEFLDHYTSDALRDEWLSLALDHDSDGGWNHGVGHWSWNLESGEFSLDAAALALVGCDRDTVPDDLDVWQTYVHPDDHTLVADAFREAMDTSVRDFRVEHRMLHRDGGIRWVEARGEILRDSNGRAVAVRGTDVDITAHKFAELRLASAEAQNRTLLESLSEAMIFLDRDLTVRWANAAALEMVGGESLVGKSCRDLFSCGTVPCEECPGRLAMETGRSVSRERDTPRGCYYLRAAPVRDATGHIVGAVETITEVTELLQTRRALANSEERFRQVVENIHETFWICSVRGTPSILYVSPAFEEVWQRPREDIYGDLNQWMEAIHPRDRIRVLRQTRQFMADPREVTMEFRIIRGDGKTRWIRSRVFPIFNPEGILERAAGISEDVTDWKEAQASLEAREAQYRSVVEQSREGICVIIGETLLFANHRAKHLWPGLWDAGEEPGLEEILPQEYAQDVRQAAEIIRSGRSGAVRFEWTFSRPERTDISLEVTLSGFEYHDQPALLMFLHNSTERRSLEEELRSAVEFTRSALDGLDSHVAIVDGSGTIQMVNHAWRAFAEGNPPLRTNVCEGANYLDVCDRADGADGPIARLFATAIRDVLAGQRETFSAEYPCHSPTEKRWFVGRITRFPGPGPARAVIAHWNVTRRRDVEDALRHNEQRLNLALDATGAGIYDRMLPPSKGWFHGGRWAELLGYARTELPSREDFMDWYFQQVHPEDRPAVKEAWETMCTGRAGTSRQEYRLRHKSGDWFFVQDVARVVEQARDGSASRIVGTLLDINERKRTELAVRKSEERMRSVLETMPVMLDALDEEYRFLVWNRECERVTGFQASEIVGNPKALELLYPDPQQRQDMLDYYRHQGGHFRNWELDITCRDGSKRTISWSSIAAETPIPGWYSWAVGVDVTERRQAEKQLRESESRYRSLFEDNISTMLLIDPESGGIVDANNAACMYYGYSPQEIRTLNIFDINTLSREEVLQEMASARKQNKRHFEFRHRLAGGEVRDVEVFSGPIPFRGRTLLYSIIHDITERKKTEDRLRESEAEMESLFASVRDCIFVVDTEGRIIRVNRAVTETLGYEEEDLMGAHLLSLHPPRLRDEARMIFDRLFRAGGGVFSLPLLSRDGRWIETETIATCARWANREVLIGVARDITERKQAEDRLRSSEARLREAQRMGRMGSWEFDVDSGTLFWSDELFRLHGKDPKDGPPTEDEYYAMYLPEDAERFRRSVQRAIQRKRRSSLDLHIQRSDGGDVFHAMTITPVEDTEGRIVKLVGTVQDISDRYAAEAREREIRERERNRIGRELHDDLGQRMTGIALMGETLRRKLEQQVPALAEEVANVVEAINRTNLHSHLLVRGLVSQDIPSGQLAGELEALAQETAKSAGIACDVEIAPAVVPDSDVVSTHLFRIAQEAINNAVKHGQPNRIEIGLRETGGCLCLEIADDGSGFDPQASVLGQGLRIMRARAEILSGTLDIESTLQGGTRVCCRLDSESKEHSI